ncbi:MAG: DMT family transporter [Pseudomonadota bacterium]
MSEIEHKRLVGLALGAGGAILFSLKGVIMKIAFENGGGVELMMALRMGMALPFFLAIGYRFRPNTGEAIPVRIYVAAGALGVLSYYGCTWLDFTGLLYISAQLERLILFLYPTFTALLAWIFLKDRLTWRHAAALCVSYVGVAVLALRELSDAGSNAALGASFVLLAAVLFAGYVTASKPVIMKMGSAYFTTIAMSTASVFIIAHFFWTHGLSGPVEDQAGVSLRLWILGAILAVLCTVMPSFMISEAIARIGPGLASAVGGIGPVATAIFAIIILGEPFGWPHATALALTTGGILLLSQATTSIDAKRA